MKNCNMTGRSSLLLTDYILYGVLYATTILSNKYVLTSLEFQYPTLFQSWQTFIGFVLMWFFSESSLSLSDIVPREIVSWLPAMFLYVGTIYSGSISLSQLPIPVYIICQSCSDVLLVLCNDSMPTGLILLSIPAKFSSCIIAVISLYQKPIFNGLLWICVHILMSGAYRIYSYWYSALQEFPSLGRQQRQFLNYSFSVLVLMPMAYFLRHHESAWNKFNHFYASKFYIGCLLSGVLGWGVNRRWNKFAIILHGSNLLMMHLFAKILTLLLSINIFPTGQSWEIWLAILLCVIGDLLHIIGTILDKQDIGMNEPSEMHDVLIGS